MGFEHFEILPKLSQLRELTLWHIYEDCSYVAGTLPTNSLPMMTSLIIQNFFCFNTQKLLMEAFAGACPNLRILEFDCPDSNWTPVLKKIIDNCSKLEKFKCLRYDDRDNNELVPLEFWQKLPDLKFLHLDGWKLSVMDAKKIMRQNSNLELLQCDGLLFIKDGASMADKEIFSNSRFKFECEHRLETICELKLKK